MLKLFSHLGKREWAMTGGALLFILGQVWFDLRLPEYMSEITVLVQTEGSSMQAVLAAGGKMLLCALGSMLLAVATGFFTAVVSATLTRNLQSALYHKVLSFSGAEMGRFSTASLITRTTNDVTQVQMLLSMGVQLIVKAPVTAVMAIFKIQEKGTPQWTLITAAAVVLLLSFIGVQIAYLLPKFRIVQKLTDNLNRIMRENLTGLRVVRAYNAERYQEGKFTAANAALTDNNLKAGRATAAMMPFISLVFNGVSLGIYWAGAYIIEAAGMADKLTIFSNMVVFSSYAMQVISSFMMLTVIFIMLPRAQVAAQRIREVLDTVPTMRDGDKTGGGTKGEVVFDHVSFRYPGGEGNVLEDISFTARPGETVAIIGATGSGKSSLVNLIPRLYDVTAGTVKVDGVDVRDYSLTKLRDKLGYVSQKAVLFAGTIRENIALGENGKAPGAASDIRAALSVAQAEEFVGGLLDGIEAPVAQGGTNFSGGQKQRLSIARAVARRPEIYIFDDSFSALDYKTDRALRERLKAEAKGATTIIVAQRIGTIMDADRIIVLEDGHAAGIGTHQELLETCPVYREIAESQLSKEELER